MVGPRGSKGTDPVYSTCPISSNGTVAAPPPSAGIEDASAVEVSGACQGEEFRVESLRCQVLVKD